MSGEFHFSEDPDEQPTTAAPSGRGVAPASGSWGKVLAITVGSCAVAAVGLWLIVPKGAPDPAPREAAAPAPGPAAAEPMKGSGAADRAKPTKHPYTGPPKITVQLGESKSSDCPVVFTESVVVRVYRGEADKVTAVVKIPKNKITRSRDLFLIDGEWSTMIGGLPTSRTTNLLVIAKGPGGQTTIAKDISHPCAGEPMDKADPFDLSTRAARQQIRHKMFSGGYNFDFGDTSGKSGSSSGSGKGN